MAENEFRINVEDVIQGLKEIKSDVTELVVIAQLNTNQLFFASNVSAVKTKELVEDSLKTYLDWDNGDE